MGDYAEEELTRQMGLSMGDYPEEEMMDFEMEKHPFDIEIGYYDENLDLEGWYWEIKTADGESLENCYGYETEREAVEAFEEKFKLRMQMHMEWCGAVRARRVYDMESDLTTSAIAMSDMNKIPDDKFTLDASFVEVLVSPMVVNRDGSHGLIEMSEYENISADYYSVCLKLRDENNDLYDVAHEFDFQTMGDANLVAEHIFEKAKRSGIPVSWEELS